MKKWRINKNVLFFGNLSLLRIYFMILNQSKLLRLISDLLFLQSYLICLASLIAIFDKNYCCYYLFNLSLFFYVSISFWLKLVLKRDKLWLKLWRLLIYAFIYIMLYNCWIYLLSKLISLTLITFYFYKYSPYWFRTLLIIKFWHSIFCFNSFSLHLSRLFLN